MNGESEDTNDISISDDAGPDGSDSDSSSNSDSDDSSSSDGSKSHESDQLSELLDPDVYTEVGNMKATKEIEKKAGFSSDSV